MKVTRAQMVAELFEVGMGQTLADAASEPRAGGVELLSELAGLTDRRLNTRYKHMVAAKAHQHDGLSLPRGRGRPSHDFSGMLDLFDEMKATLQVHMPEGMVISDALMLLLFCAVQQFEKAPDGTWQYKRLTSTEALQAMERLEQSETGTPVEIRRHMKSLRAAFSRERTRRKQRD